MVESGGSSDLLPSVEGDGERLDSWLQQRVRPPGCADHRGRLTTGRPVSNGDHIPTGDGC